MNYIGYELIWLFFAYSFLGWILETIGAAARQRRFVNRGLVNAPLCVIYGVAAVMITMFGSGLSVFWLFVGSAILATVVEWIGGHVLERLYDEKWWDYSKVKWNLDGYICLPASLFWGFLGTTAFKLENPILLRLFHLLPQKAGEVVLLLLGAALIIDAVASIAIISGKSQWMDRWKSIDSWFTAISIRLGSWVYGWVGRRIERAYPRSLPRTKSRTKEKSFAAGCSPYKIILLFIIGSFLGDIVETVFCRVQAGYWMSLSALCGAAPSPQLRCSFINTRIGQTAFFSLWERYWAAFTNICAAYCRKWYSGPFSGITVRSPLIWEGVLIFCTVSSGDLRLWSGLKACTRFCLYGLNGSRSGPANGLSGFWRSLCAAIWPFRPWRLYGATRDSEA